MNWTFLSGEHDLDHSIWHLIFNHFKTSMWLKSSWFPLCFDHTWFICLYLTWGTTMGWVNELIAYKPKGQTWIYLLLLPMISAFLVIRKCTKSILARRPRSMTFACTVKPPNYGLLTNGNSFIRNKFSYINLFPCHLIVNNVSEQRKFPYPEQGNLLNVKWRETVPVMPTFPWFSTFSSTQCARDKSKRQSYEKVWPGFYLDRLQRITQKSPPWPMLKILRNTVWSLLLSRQIHVARHTCKLWVQMKSRKINNLLILTDL